MVNAINFKFIKENDKYYQLTYWYSVLQGQSEITKEEYERSKAS